MGWQQQRNLSRTTLRCSVSSRAFSKARPLPRCLQQITLNSKFPYRGVTGRCFPEAGIFTVNIFLVVTPLCCTLWINQKPFMTAFSFAVLCWMDSGTGTAFRDSTVTRSGQESQSWPISICGSSRVDVPYQVKRKTLAGWHSFFLTLSLSSCLEHGLNAHECGSCLAPWGQTDTLRMTEYCFICLVLSCHQLWTWE